MSRLSPSSCRISTFSLVGGHCARRTITAVYSPPVGRPVGESMTSSRSLDDSQPISSGERWLAVHDWVRCGAVVFILGTCREKLMSQRSVGLGRSSQQRQNWGLGQVGYVRFGMQCCREIPSDIVASGGGRERNASQRWDRLWSENELTLGPHRRVCKLSVGGKAAMGSVKQYTNLGLLEATDRANWIHGLESPSRMGCEISPSDSV